MSSSAGPTMPDDANAALAAELVSLRDSLNTPETVGRALANYVLTEAVTQGKQVDADTFEIPMTVSDDTFHLTHPCSRRP